MILGQSNSYPNIWRVLVWTSAVGDQRPLNIYRIDTNTGRSPSFGASGLCLGDGEQMIIRRRGRHLEVLIEKPWPGREQSDHKVEQHALEAG